MEEQREDYEAASMAAHDKQNPRQEVELQPQVQLDESVVLQPDATDGIFDDAEPGGDGQPEAAVEVGPNPSLGLEVPSTPMVYFEVLRRPPADVPSSSTAAGSADVPLTPRTSPVMKKQQMTKSTRKRRWRIQRSPDSCSCLSNMLR